MDVPLLKYQPNASNQGQASPETAANICTHPGYLPEGWQLPSKQDLKPLTFCSPTLGHRESVDVWMDIGSHDP